MPGSRPPGVTLSNWDLGGEPSAWAYLHAGELFPSVEIPVAGPPTALPEAEAAEIADFPVRPGMSLQQYVASGPVTGIVVVWRGRIAFERYPRMQPGERHLLMSVTKAFAAAVAGILESRGVLDLRQPVDALIGELAGSGWTGVCGTDVLAMAQLCVSGTGAPASHGGLSVTLRDLARFGMLLTPSARLVSQYPVISGEHLRRMQAGGRPELHGAGAGSTSDDASRAYGPRLPPASRQWDYAMADGDLFKGGFGGQGLYVSPSRDLVIVFTGTPRHDGSVNLLRWYSRRLALALS